MVAITIMTVVAFGIRLWQRSWAMAPIGWESKCGSGHDLLYVHSLSRIEATWLFDALFLSGAHWPSKYLQNTWSSFASAFVARIFYPIEFFGAWLLSAACA